MLTDVLTLARALGWLIGALVVAVPVLLLLCGASWRLSVWMAEASPWRGRP